MTWTVPSNAIPATKRDISVECVRRTSNRAKRTCECSKKEGHAKENSQYIKVICFRCGERGHLSFVCEEDEKEEGKKRQMTKGGRKETNTKNKEEKKIIYICKKRGEEENQD